LKIWKHPLITGYIDTDTILNPTISRDNYKTDADAKRLFKEIRKLEPEILKFINNNVSKNKKYNFEKIEGMFNDKVKQFHSNLTRNVSVPIEQFSDVISSVDPNDPELKCLLLYKNSNSKRTNSITGNTGTQYSKKKVSGTVDLYDDSKILKINV